MKTIQILVLVLAGAAWGCTGEVAEGPAPVASDPVQACMAGHGCSYEAPFWQCPKSVGYPTDCGLPSLDCGYVAQFSCQASGLSDTSDTGKQPIFAGCATGCSPRFVAPAGSDACSVQCVPRAQ